MQSHLRTLVRTAVQAQRALEPDRVICSQPGCAPSADGNALLLVEADAERIIQAIPKYLSIALKYFKADRPVEVVVESIEAVEAEGGHARMARVDTGPGFRTRRRRAWRALPAR